MVSGSLKILILSDATNTSIRHLREHILPRTFMRIKVCEIWPAPSYSETDASSVLGN